MSHDRALEDFAKYWELAQCVEGEAVLGILSDDGKSLGAFFGRVEGYEVKVEASTVAGPCEKILNCRLVDVELPNAGHRQEDEVHIVGAVVERHLVIVVGGRVLRYRSPSLRIALYTVLRWEPHPFACELAQRWSRYLGD